MDWHQFHRKIRVNASTDRVYLCWTSTSELSKWFLKSAKIVSGSTDGICRKADHVEWIWNNVDMVTPIEILEANGKDELRFSFGHGMEVNILLTQEDRFTVVDLLQTNIPTDDESKFNFFAGCMRGWTFWLTNLKAYLEHHIVLHDPDLGKRDDLFDYCNT